MRWSVPLLIAMVLLSGCAADTPDAPLSSSSAPTLDGAGEVAQHVAAATNDTAAPQGPLVPFPAQEVRWTLDNCTFAIAIVSIDAAKLAPYLPEGFRSLSTAEIGFPGTPNPNDEGNLGIELFDCVGADGAASSYGATFTTVQAPPAYTRSEADYHFVKFEVVVPAGGFQDLLRDYGITARTGSATFTQAMSDGSNSLHDGLLSTDDAAPTAFRGTGGVQWTDGTLVEYSLTPGGLAEWGVRYSWTSGGLGPQTVAPGEGTLAAKLLGNTAPATGVGFSGHASFEGGTLHLPAQPVA